MQSRQKQSLNPMQMLEIALHHRDAARQLLQTYSNTGRISGSSLLPVTTLLCISIELTFKACLLQEYGKLRPARGLLDLFGQISLMELSQEERKLLKKLAQQQAFRKGMDYSLWENEQQLQVFAHRVLDLQDCVLKQIPVELQKDYWT